MQCDLATPEIVYNDGGTAPRITLEWYVGSDHREGAFRHKLNWIAALYVGATIVWDGRHRKAIWPCRSEQEAESRWRYLYDTYTVYAEGWNASYDRTQGIGQDGVIWEHNCADPSM